VVITDESKRVYCEKLVLISSPVTLVLTIIEVRMSQINFERPPVTTAVESPKLMPYTLQQYTVLAMINQLINQIVKYPRRTVNN